MGILLITAGKVVPQETIIYLLPGPRWIDQGDHPVLVHVCGLPLHKGTLETLFQGEVAREPQHFHLIRQYLIVGDHHKGADHGLLEDTCHGHGHQPLKDTSHGRALQEGIEQENDRRYLKVQELILQSGVPLLCEGVNTAQISCMNELLDEPPI